LIYLKKHYNPIIRKITHLILDQKYDQVQYKGNPIKDFTNISILKRFSLAPIKKTAHSEKIHKSRRST